MDEMETHVQVIKFYTTSSSGCGRVINKDNNTLCKLQINSALHCKCQCVKIRLSDASQPMRQDALSALYF